MNEGSAKAARRAARAHGLMPAYPVVEILVSGVRPFYGHRTRSVLGKRPMWKLPRAIARDYQAFPHRDRGQQRTAWDRVAFCFDVESHPAPPRSRF